MIKAKMRKRTRTTTTRAVKKVKPEIPKIVCLCGSPQFKRTFIRLNREETLKGNIILTFGFFSGIDSLDEDTKKALETTHLRKIDLCDEVLVVDVDKYIDDTTNRYIEYAKARKKNIVFLSEREQS